MTMLAAMAVVCLVGCETYQLRGRVVRGGTPMMLIVDADDPQLEGPGVSGAHIDLTLDPDSLGRKSLDSGRSGPNGDFAIPIDEFGAGTLEYKIGAIVRQTGYAPVSGKFIMPGDDRRLLIVMRRGQDHEVDPSNQLDRAREILEAEDAKGAP